MVQSLRLTIVRLMFTLGCAALAGLAGLALAAQRTAPGWWDPDGVGSGSDWHYRVAVTLPATSSVNSTAKVDIDFAALMTQLGIAGTFDPNSVRVVRPGGALATVQEYNDTIYAGTTDSTATRGEVRWIVQDAGTQVYQVYFDITQNGAKAANPQTPINGNFERSASGTQLPAGWATANRTNATYDLQVRPNESVSVTSDGSPTNNPFTTDGAPLTGSFSYLLGARTNNEPVAGAAQLNAAVLTRTITVPASNAGNLVVRWRAEGWDSSDYDNLFVRITTSGGAITEIVGNTLNSYPTWPTAPNIGGAQVGLFSAGYGHYNGFDMTSSGTHQNGMTVALRAQPWWSRSYSLAAFAGQTVTLSIGSNHTEQFKSWFHVDDVEWSVVTGTLGAAEGFGVGITAPAGNLTPGQTVRITATVDARPTGAGSPVTADVYYPNGTPYLTGVVLYNDGAHGDGAANDAVWASDSITVALSSPASTGWLVRGFVRDASTSTLGTANNGLVHRNGLPNPQVMANWWNIDERNFAIIAAVMNVSKSSTMVSDTVNTVNFKTLPGGVVQYCLTIGNSGNADASSVVAFDNLPGTLSYVPGSMRSGADCSTAATVEDDDTAGGDETDPVGASRSGAELTIQRGLLATGASFAVTYQATIN
jgi:uncharacterized repeat protein (TIGR01451 family)